MTFIFNVFDVKFLHLAQKKVADGMILEGDIKVNKFFEDVRARVDRVTRDFLQVSGYAWETSKVPYEFEENACNSSFSY